MRETVLKAIVGACALAVMWCCAVSAQELEGFDLRAELVPAEQAPGFAAELRLEVSCQPEYYAWSDSIQVELLDTGGAEGTIGIREVQVPPHKSKYDEALEQQVDYLDGTFTIRAYLDIASETEPGIYDLTVRLSFTGCGPGICQFLRPQATVPLTVSRDVAPTLIEIAAPLAAPPAEDAADSEPTVAERGWLVGILIAFVAGLGLSLTPCVYPLIPVTIALVGATGERSRLDGLVRSLVYVLGISVSYSTIGVVAAATGSVFGTILQHPAVYLTLAVVFVVLAGGMFDLYTIELTSQRLQRLQARLRGRAGMVGIFVVGLLSGVAVTACIAPVIVGALSYVAQSGNLLVGFLMFFALAWGMGTPLVFLGTFTGLAKSVPKAGQWMVTVKHVFGVALLALAVFFVGKSRILPPYAVLLLGAALAFAVAAVAFYRAGQAAATGTRRRWLLAVGVAMLAAGAGLLARPGADTGPTPSAGPQINWHETAEAAMPGPQREGKPVVLDFWAPWCAPCLRMLRTTFVDAQVVAASRRFACAKIDVDALSADERSRMREEYGLRGVPTLVLIGTDGQRHTETGEVGPEAMLELLRSVR